jgi:hypothetical protein
MKRGHDSTLAHDVCRSGEARAGRGEAEDEAALAIAVIDGDEVGKARMAFWYRVDRNHTKVWSTQAFATLCFEIGADLFAQSRCAVSAIVATIRTSPSARTTLTLV